jgi:hypothetical protein
MTLSVIFYTGGGCLVRVSFVGILYAPHFTVWNGTVSVAIFYLSDSINP